MNRLLCACLLAATGTAANAQLTTQEIANGIDRPVFITHAGDGSGRLFVIEQEGAIRIIDADGNLLPTKFMDIDGTVIGGDSGGNEQGLLGLAFHPDYATEGADGEGKFYVNYTGSGGDTRIAEYQVSADNPNVADPGTARIIMFYDQPFSNHNGGWLDFGADGYLYIAAGDGGAGNDPGNRAARLNQFLGKMHRINVDGGDDFPDDANQNYEIPADNPFVGTPGAIESIWHYGLRNPWRSSFDQETGDMWIADVGQNAFEEVNHNVGNVGGVNYGWRCREAFQATGLSCGATDWTDPVHAYALNGGNCAIIGGYVYRGCDSAKPTRDNTSSAITVAARSGRSIRLTTHAPPSSTSGSGSRLGGKTKAASSTSVMCSPGRCSKSSTPIRLTTTTTASQTLAKPCVRQI
ncbi:MAG: PQQ-dependent sugar dehydrogenase [Phycisphaerales bacterium]|nr:PQQ-dependent sugar dehydrogenase [Phycisphaerales bacterium]